VYRGTVAWKGMMGDPMRSNVFPYLLSRIPFENLLQHEDTNFI